MGDQKAKTEKNHCNRCLLFTNHITLHSENTSWDEELNDDQGIYISGGDTWCLLQCCGCDSVRLRHRHWFSEDTDERGEAIIHTEYFPPNVTRQKPQWRRQFLPYSAYLESYNGLCDEIYGALATGAHRLAVMGIRALVEKLMIDQVGDQGSFEKNIKSFFAQGHVAPKQQGIFRDTLLEAGHAAMHRNFEPSSDTVNTLLDIVEGILHAIYYAPLLAENVKKSIPERQMSRTTA